MDEFADFCVSSYDTDPCRHVYTTDYAYGSLQICEVCGETQEVIEYTAEWRNHNVLDGSHAKDPSRCRFTTTTTSRSIRSFLELRKFSEAVISATIRKYNEIVEKKTIRGDKRKGILAVCLWKTLQETNDVRELREIRQIFEVDRKHVTKGLALYNKTYPGERTEVITASSLFPRVLHRAGLASELLDTVENIYTQIANKSCALNRSNPQSVAAAIVWFSICLDPRLKREYCLNKRRYAQRVGLSEITISKLAKEAAKCLPSAPGDLKI